MSQTTELPFEPPAGEKKRKPKALRTVIILAVVLLAAAASVLFLLNRPKTVYLDDYFTLRASGTDGYGTAAPQWDGYELQPLNEYLSEKDADGDVSLTDYVSVRVEPAAGLRNGDKVKLVIDAPAGFEKSHKVRFKLRNDTAEIKGLAEIVGYDPIQAVNVRFSGYAGHGSFAFDLPEEPVKTAFGTATYSIEEPSRMQVVLEGKNSARVVLTYAISAPDVLKNDDLITVTLSSDDLPSTEALATGFCIAVPDGSTTYTVSGLGEVTEPDPAPLLSISYQGFDGAASATVTAAQETLQAGEHTLTISANKSANQRYYLRLAIPDEQGAAVCVVTYYAVIGDDLKNDDVITFRAGETDLEQMLSGYGISLPSEIAYTVSGLETRTEVDAREQLIFRFDENEEGYFSLSLELKQESITVGDYTVNLEVALYPNDYRGDYWAETFTIVDGEGNEVASGVYDTDEIYWLPEGETISFDARLFDPSELFELTGLRFSTERLQITVSAGSHEIT